MIDGVIFRNVRYCARCIFTTVDPNKGEKRTDGEPLKTLKEIRMSSDPEVRKAHNAPYFGILLAVDHEFNGTINKGGQVYVINKSKVVETTSPWTSMLIQSLLFSSIALFSYSIFKKFN